MNNLNNPRKKIDLSLSDVLASVRWRFQWQRVVLVMGLATALALVANAQGKETQPNVKQDLDLAQKFESEGDLKEATRYLNDAAMAVWEAKNYDDAIVYFNRSIELNKRIKNFSGISKLNSNLGMIYSDLAQYDKSLSYFQQSLDYRLREGEKTEIISTYINTGVVLNNLKRYNDAATDLEKALKLSTEMNDAAQMKSCYGMLSETYEKAGNQEKSRYYYDLYRTFHEMIQRNKVNEAKKETEAAQLQAELSKKEKELKELQLLNTKKELGLTEAELKNLDKEARNLIETNTKQQLAMSLLQREVELEELRLHDSITQNNQQRLWILLSAVALVGAFSIVGLLYRSYWYKKKTNQQLADQNEEIRSLNDNLEEQVQHRTVELQTTLKKLEKRNQELDQFSHVISHNLRGPVASILGLGKVLNRDNPSDPINAEIFNRLLGATKNLDTVVKDLSVIIQVRDQQSLPKEKVRIEKLISSVLQLQHEEIKESKAGIILDDAEALEVLTVKPYAESILFNLVSNAIKYRAAERPLQIKIKTAKTDKGTMVSVADNGTGISSNHLDQIFQPYKRFTTEGEGKGLGLYLVKSQVEAMGGTIGVNSETGKGSTFTFILP